MTKLSVNINKIAVVRNSRGGNRPDVVRAALDIERFGADGITVHPRPDARHIRYDDVRALKRVLSLRSLNLYKVLRIFKFLKIRVREWDSYPFPGNNQTTNFRNVSSAAGFIRSRRMSGSSMTIKRSSFLMVQITDAE